MNFKLLIQYDGTDFHGWQVQENARTIQGELERVIGALEGSPVKVAGSGRTDAGVHAEGQVANVKLNRSWTEEKLRNAINGNLWRDIRIVNAEKSDDNFHARFSAKGKTYVYRIVNAPVMSPFWRRYALHETRPLDVARMSMAARLLLGEHDWTAYSSALSESENKVRNVTEAEVNSVWDGRACTNVIEFKIRANGFLRYMVRSIAGTLLEVGRGERESDTIQAALANRDRYLAGQTAPACGLTLVKVDY
ncbi:MAG TPA: tRNA pseudouridine(38-40) synthase TruA [Pyrinomonadaceae bacterium]|nr:tRNA pseudouridine(38-40) synthase TruA [Pyrinomonadaceae bacterium]